MLSQCANPECKNSFRYLHQGRVFVLDCGTANESETRDGSWLVLGRRFEAFWLCDDCSRRWTLQFNSGRVITMPVSRIAVEMGRASQRAA